MAHLFSDKALSTRLESFAAGEMRRFVATARVLDADSKAASLEVAGGVAIYLGPGSPVNQAIGLALAEKFTDADAEAIESFYTARGQRGSATLSPLADRSLFVKLGRRGWRVDGFVNVLFREIEPGERFARSPEIEVMIAEDDEAKAVWAEVSSVGFSAPLDPPPMQRALARLAAARSGSVLLLALVDGTPAGSAEMSIEGDVAWFSADSTLPLYRRRGAQQALQTERLQLAADAGCTLAVTEAQPGSASQRNMERAGFRVAYTRTELLAPPLGESGER